MLLTVFLYNDHLSIPAIFWRSQKWRLYTGSTVLSCYWSQVGEQTLLQSNKKSKIVLNLLCEVSTLQSLVTKTLVNKEIQPICHLSSYLCCQIVMSQRCISYVTTWCSLVHTCLQQVKTFLICHVTSQDHDWRNKWLYGWMPLKVSGGQRPCGAGDMFLICQMISQDHVIKRLCDFMSVSSSG